MCSYEFTNLVPYSLIFRTLFAMIGQGASILSCAAPATSFSPGFPAISNCETSGNIACAANIESKPIGNHSSAGLSKVFSYVSFVDNLPS